MPHRPAPRDLTATPADWAALLDEVSRGEVRVLLDSSTGGQVVLVSAGDLDRLERAAQRGLARVELTPRERQVLERVEAGERAPAIAEALGLARGTVVQHLASARRKYGVRTSREAAARAREAAALGGAPTTG
ncbi:response regulator transcription factor [Quadrisphaera sp. INWT6]|uniref:response regulator transcription factor n=1 Tax=Quadrisphaera sp. INWT6 TaxID=2596917 RepID=UPI001892589E|nr:LuxR C-terminal-related transcriptional regulator [Quadrisphaera sp. INWT6]